MGFLTLSLDDDVFNNKSFHDVKYMSGNWFYLWLVLVSQPWICKMLVLVSTTFIFFACFMVAIHKIWKYICTRNDKPSMYIRKPFLHVYESCKKWNQIVIKCILEETCWSTLNETIVYVKWNQMVMNILPPQLNLLHVLM